MADADDTERGTDARRSSVSHFSLLNSLLAVINTGESDSTDALLARYFLEHFDRLDSLNVYDVASDCYTSRSGVRRFCQSIGLENFSDLKSYEWEWARHRALYVGYTDHDDFRSYLQDSIGRMAEQINLQVSDEDLDDFAYLIHDTKNVVILTSDFSSMAIRQFQQSMVYLHKTVYVITDTSADLSILSALGSSDAVIVVSEHGNYARASREILEKTPTSLALVSADADEHLAAQFDLSVRLSSEKVRQGRSVYATYGMTYFFDLLYHRYYKLFVS